MPFQQACLWFEPKVRGNVLTAAHFDSMLTGAQLEKVILGANVYAPVCACAFTIPCSSALLRAVVQAVNRTGYKWMLYGDDDTMWFVGGVLDVLKDLDPEMPYIITGKQPFLFLRPPPPPPPGWC